MNRKAISSSSPVVTPGLICSRSMANAAAVILPASRIRWIWRFDLRMII